MDVPGFRAVNHALVSPCKMGKDQKGTMDRSSLDDITSLVPHGTPPLSPSPTTTPSSKSAPSVARRLEFPKAIVYAVRQQESHFGNYRARASHPRPPQAARTTGLSGR